MSFSEREVQNYIWNHRGDLFSMIDDPSFENDPNKLPWEYEPWELLYYRALDDYKDSFNSLRSINLFGCEVSLSKTGDSTIRADLMGYLEGENGFVICELKVNREPERQAYTEMFAYANHVRGKIAPMGRKDIFYLLISPMEERIVREATINNLLYDKNRVIALIPEVGETIDSLRFRLWIPPKDEFRIIAKTAFSANNIDVFRISWRGVAGKWSPVENGRDPDEEMIHQLNKVSHYAAQLMEANGINGFVFCVQSYPSVRDAGYLENGITLCGINPYKAAESRFVLDLQSDIEDSFEPTGDLLKMGTLFPSLKERFKKESIEDDSYGWMTQSWSACLDRIAFEVINRVNLNLGQSIIETGHGCFTWNSYQFQSSEDRLCWNYDISLTGVFRELYDIKIDRYYRFKYSDEQKMELLEQNVLEWNSIDMINDHQHIRRFIEDLIGKW